MALDPRIGAGARIGYAFTDRLELEVEFGLAQPHTRNQFGFTTVRWGGASLVLNIAPGRRNRPYLLGGYSRIDYGSAASAPYDFADHALHGAIGDRLFIMDGVALRFEGRAMFAPKTDRRFGGEWAGHVVGSVGLAMFALGRGPGDADQDRVNDPQDGCPGTPPRAVVDRRGCPADRDGDAVADGIDRCAATPASAQVDRSGCPIDRDADGVYDGIDQCGNSPSGVTVDARGCPLDADADGVADQLDRCPRSAAGVRVDASGCALVRDSVPPLFSDRGSMILHGVTFGSGSSILTPGSFTVLDGVATSLIAQPEIRVEIAGSTDDAGAASLNIRLSQLRAEAVRGYLATRGVAPGRMVARGFGPGSPIAVNTTAAGRAQNRRIELHRLP
ncbi:MAG: OmpA family protein [Candidatus Methylomirabilaceae bacterium]